MSRFECRPICPASINVRARLFVCRCGGPGRINHFYDAAGCRTDDADDAVSAAIALDNGEWVSVVLADFDERAPLQ